MRLKKQEEVSLYCSLLLTVYITFLFLFDSLLLFHVCHSDRTCIDFHVLIFGLFRGSLCYCRKMITKSKNLFFSFTNPVLDSKQTCVYCSGWVFVCLYFQGIDTFKKQLIEVTLQQPYMGEHIPAVWLTFENNIEK